MGIRPAVKKSFGACGYSKTSPPVSAVSPSTKILNIAIPFEQALKLNVAVDECIRTLNSYNRATRAGKQSGLTLAIHLPSQRITVHEGRIIKTRG